MADEKDPKDPSQVSDAYAVMAPRWELANALLGGTEAMRRAAQTYLPTHSEETDAAYQDRLSSAVLLNMYGHTLDTLVGKPFTVSEEERRKDKDAQAVNLVDVPEDIEALMDDVDLQGNELAVFLRNWFSEGVSKTFCHVLVDYPRKGPEIKTLEDERKAGLRPYWVLIKPENVLAARSTLVRGREMLTHLRILEEYVVADGFIDVVKQRIRVLEPGTVQIFEPHQEKGKKVEWVQTEAWTTGVPYITFVTFYTDRQALMLGKSKLQDLADMNVRHWQSSADQSHILTVARFPILACSGSEEGGDITIGPNKIFYVPNPQGKYYYVEHQGTAIEAGRKDLQDLEAQMAGYGAQFLKKRPGTETATAVAIDSAQATSVLGAMVSVFCDAVAQALAYTALWLGHGDQPAGTVRLNTSWEVLDGSDAAALEALRAAREGGDLSRKAHLTVLKARGLLPEDFDPEEDWKQMQAEAWQKMAPQMVQQLLAAEQGKQLSFTEARAVFRKLGWATQDDSAAKDEIEQDLDKSMPQFPPGPLEPPLPGRGVTPKVPQSGKGVPTPPSKEPPSAAK